MMCGCCRFGFGVQRHIRHAAIIVRLQDSEDHQYGMMVHYMLSRLKIRFSEFIMELWDQMASVQPSISEFTKHYSTALTLIPSNRIHSRAFARFRNTQIETKLRIHSTICLAVIPFSIHTATKGDPTNIRSEFNTSEQTIWVNGN